MSAPTCDFDSPQRLLGDLPTTCRSRPLAPYAAPALALLGALSSQLLAHPAARKYSDVVAFAYWCRKANLEQMRRRHGEHETRLGRGIAFHITPGNVPTNFAFSFAFALLAGNASIVRLPSQHHPQIELIIDVLKGLFEQEAFTEIARMSCFLRYPRNDRLTQEISAHCQSRILWGGNQTINAIRKIPAPERCIEIAFPDRRSLCVLDARTVAAADAAQLGDLVARFYNDCYLFDQHACSSPSLVIWVGAPDDVSKAQTVFWPALHALTQAKYTLEPADALRKHAATCRALIDIESVAEVRMMDSRLCRMRLDHPDPAIEDSHCGWGTFLEYSVSGIDALAPMLSSRYQTMTYFGVALESLRELVVQQRLSGIDRVVPVGSALDIGIFWDGYDLVRALSRHIDFRST